MNYNLKKKLLFIIIPFLTFLICAFSDLIFNDIYLNSIDPDFVYLINGLNVFRGDFNSIIHVDHPGTPLQMLIGVLISIIGTIRGADNITMDVFSNPQTYIRTIILIFAFFHALVLFFIGLRYYKHQNNLFHSILLQCSFIISSTLILSQSKLFTETLLPLGSLLLILLSIEFVWGKMKELKFTFLSGIIVGIFVAVKITFFPLLILPLILIIKWRHKLLFVITSILFFILSVLPIISKLTFFKEFILGIATHDGLYGKGQESPISISFLIGNIWKLLNIDYSFSIIVVFSIIVLVYMMIKYRKEILKKIEFRLLFAITIVFLAQLLMVSKHAGIRYMIPAVILSMLALTVIIRQFKSNKIIIISLITLVFVFSIINQISTFSANIDNYQLQKKSLNFVRTNIKNNDAVLVVSKDSWMGSPFVAHSIMFGKLYCASQGPQYAKYLKKIYPKFYFWTHHNQQYCDWENNIMPDQFLSSNQSFYLYIQTDYPEFFQSVMADFKQRLKYQNPDSVDFKLCYSDTILDEAIYQVNIHHPEVPKPKFSLFCDFEENALNQFTLIRTSVDSINIEDGLRRTDYDKFEGKFSICITKENPYGISVKLDNIHQYDFFKIRLMCRRASQKDECCIALKSVNPNDGFSTSGGSFIEQINGWEKIQFTYRLNYEPTDGKIEMFVWNISKNPMYFDNLHIEIY